MPLDSKIDAIGTLPYASAGDDAAATAGGDAGPAADAGAGDPNGQGTEAGFSVAGMASGTLPGMESAGDEVTTADAEREARREEIARAAAKDVDDAVIVSHDDDEGDDDGEASALF